MSSANFNKSSTLHVLVDIGCIECGEDSHLLGIFTDVKDALSCKLQAEVEHKKNWSGQHEFIIFPWIMDIQKEGD